MAEVKIFIKGEEMEEKEQVEQFMKSLNHERKIYLRGFLSGILSNVEREEAKS